MSFPAFTRTLAVSAAAFSLVILPHCTAPPPPETPDGRPGGGGAGYVSADRGAWKAWQDAMPGPGSKTLHIQGEVTVSAANYGVSLARQPSTAGSLHYEVRVNRTGDMGAQVITTRRIDFSAPYDGGHDSLTVHLPDGGRFQLPITRAH